ncbi:MAG TPA: GAF domain-containing protein [Vicinamibacterales bacterium]|jgi:formate hydrogenlyase transcriptional activator
MDTSGPDDRARMLLAITNALVPHLTRETLFQAITTALRSVIQFDRSTIFLYDEQKNVLRLVSTDGGVPTDAFVPGMELALDGSHSGWTFVNQRPFYNLDLATQRTYPGEEVLFREGFRSFVVLPLIVRGTSIGTLNLGSLHPNPFSDAELDFLQDVASQIALALSNMREHEETRRLKSQLERENVYLREELLRQQYVSTDGSAAQQHVAESPPIAPTAAAVAASGTLEEVERAHILAALAQTGWVIEGPRGAAKILGLHPNTLRSRLKRLGLERARHGVALPPPVEGV